MSSSVATESFTPISGGCGDGGGTSRTTTSFSDNPMKEEAVDSISNPFQEGEIVLAYHGLCLYDAKVQRVESCAEGRRYFIHYTGWNKSWDEWLVVDKLLKRTEENIQKQKELKDKHSAEKNTKSGRSSQDRIKSPPGVRGRKRKHETIKMEKGFLSLEKHVDIQIPSALKKQLVNDHDCITQRGLKHDKSGVTEGVSIFLYDELEKAIVQLVKLPRTPSVYDISNKYFEYQVKKDDMITETVKEIVDGLRCYFDKALPAMLLYKEERQQYKEVIADDASPSCVYGAEHLLRLFVKLPEMLSCVHIETETLSELQQRLLDFLRFLESNQIEFFDSN